MVNWEPSDKAKRKMLFRNLPGYVVDYVLENYESEGPAEVPGAFVREAKMTDVPVRVVFFPGDPIRVLSVHEVRPLPKPRKGKR